MIGKIFIAENYSLEVHVDWGSTVTMIHGGIVSLTSWTWNPWINERRKEKREGMYTWLILCLYTLIKRLKINWIFSLIPPPPHLLTPSWISEKNSVSAPDQTYKCNYIWLVTITYRSNIQYLKFKCTNLYTPKTVDPPPLLHMT